MPVVNHEPHDRSCVGGHGELRHIRQLGLAGCGQDKEIRSHDHGHVDQRHLVVLVLNDLVQKPQQQLPCNTTAICHSASNGKYITAIERY